MIQRKLLATLLICCNVAAPGINAMNYNYPYLHPHLTQNLPPQTTQQQPVPSVQQITTQELERIVRTEVGRFALQQEYITQQACTTAVNKAFAKVFLGTLGVYLLYKFYTHNKLKKQQRKQVA